MGHARFSAAAGVIDTRSFVGATSTVRAAGNPAKRPRISIDVDPDFRRRVRVAAAQREVSVRDYVLGALEAQLREDASGEDRVAPLNWLADPVLAELWDNPFDARYDELFPR